MACNRQYMDEAQRFMTASKASLSTQQRTGERTDTVSAIYSRIATYMLNHKQEFKSRGVTRLSFEDIKTIIRNSNFPCTDGQIKQSLDEYAQLEIFHLDTDSYDIMLHDLDYPDKDMDEFYDSIQFPRPADATGTDNQKRRRD